MGGGGPGCIYERIRNETQERGRKRRGGVCEKMCIKKRKER